VSGLHIIRHSDVVANVIPRAERSAGAAVQKLEPQPLGEHPHAQRQQAKTARENAGKLRFDAVEVGGSFLALADLLDEFKRDCGSETLQVDIVAICICVELKSTPLSNRGNSYFNTLQL
jgi:hypothetical protein